MTNMFWFALIGLFLPMVLSQDALTEQYAELCESMNCKKPRGSWCQVVMKEGVPTAECRCPVSCAGYPEKPVCSVFGKQYDNICEFHRFQCKKKKVIRLAFEKPCVASQQPCTKQEYSQFPYRLLEWFMHLKSEEEMGRIDPNQHIIDLGPEVRENVAMWKFDQMDENNDDQLDKRELLRFRYALMPLEHCAAPFFSRCAKGDKIAKKISAQEWVDCLKVYDELPPEEAEENAQTEAEAQQPVDEVEEEEEDGDEEEDEQ
ncbi:SPARC-like [Diadema setosum]|uniref:SPARC-like n=1 Tax=Diadema setosum TaxID=31175 RepID=UPI003B3BD8DE